MHRKLMDAEKQRVQDVWALLKVGDANPHHHYPQKHTLYTSTSHVIPSNPPIHTCSPIKLNLFHPSILLFVHPSLLTFCHFSGPEHPHPALWRGWVLRCGGVGHL